MEEGHASHLQWVPPKALRPRSCLISWYADVSPATDVISTSAQILCSHACAKSSFIFVEHRSHEHNPCTHCLKSLGPHAQIQKDAGASGLGVAGGSRPPSQFRGGLVTPKETHSLPCPTSLLLSTCCSKLPPQGAAPREARFPR